MLLGVIFLVLGLGLGAGAFIAFARTRNFLATAYATTGEVLALEATPGNDGTVYYPVLRFRTHEGAQTQVRAAVGSNRPGFEVGQSVTVLYDPENPSDARIQSFVQLWLATMVLGLVGGGFALVGATMAAVQFLRR